MQIAINHPPLEGSSEYEHSYPTGTTKSECEFQDYFFNLPYVKSKIKKGVKYHAKKGLEIDTKPFYNALSNLITHHKTSLDLISSEKLNLKYKKTLKKNKKFS